MSEIARQIWVTQRLRIQPIDIVYGSQVGISIQLMDYEIPSGASIKAYARGKNTTTTYESNCSYSGNNVFFTPPEGFFVPGLNLLQVEVNGAIIPFSINVNCEGRISELGDTAPPEKVRPLVERAVTAASEAEAASSNASKSATAAAGSANAAKSSETNAKASETAAKTAATTAANDANAAVAPLIQRAETAASDAETAATDAETALGQVPASAEATVRPYAERAEIAATRAEQALQTMENNYQDIGALQTRLKSGKVEDAELHLGWYLDADGKLQPNERGINMGNQSLTGLPTPMAGTDGANKEYVDRVRSYAAGLHVGNLLDNSDYTNPVAQAGVGGKHGTVSYAVDRWILDSGTASLEPGVGLTLNGAIRQKLECPPAGSVSAFVGMASGSANISYADGEVTVTSAGGVLKWAALYEGEYTAETLPPYVGKEYGVELAECMRYYYRSWKGSLELNDLSAIFAPTANRTTSMDFPIPMRIIPTITLYNPATGSPEAIGKWSDDSDVPAQPVYPTDSHFLIGGSLTAGEMYSVAYEAFADL